MEKIEKNEKLETIEKYGIESVDDIVNFDFSSENEFKIDENYELIKHTKKPSETKELIEKRDADKIIEDTSSNFLDENYVKLMNDGYNNLISLLKKYDVNSDLVKNMTEEEKDKIYGIAEYLFNEYQKNLNNMDFIFELTQDEWKFMLDVIKNKLEYDQNEIFQLKEVREQYLEKSEELYKDIPNGENIPTVINVNNLIILYHLISKYKVKGLNKSHYSYLSLLTKIGERIKLFNAYTLWVQRLSDDFKLWGGSLTVDDDIKIKEKK